MRSLRLLCTLALLATFAGSASAQDRPRATTPTGDDDYRQFFKKPTNTPEYWNALQFEIEVGKYDLAAVHLRNFLNYKPGDADLVKLADEVGVAAFLKLRNIRRWSDDPKANKEALDNVEQLIRRVTDAVRTVRNDPERIRGHIQKLYATPEENAYAVKELAKSGAVAVPYLIDALRQADAEQRLRLREALLRLGPDTVEPMAAALDGDDVALKVDLIRILVRRYARQAVPYLWFLADSPTQPDEVRREATAALAFFLETPPGKLPAGKRELTRLAERYYLHQVKFPDPNAVTIWRWDGRGVVAGWPGAATVNADRAEEYYGLRFAGQALQLDPAYTPAQAVLLSLVLDKAQGKAGLDQMLERAAPSVRNLLGTVRPELVIDVLERALEEHRLTVILGAVRDLGERDEVRAWKPMGRQQPPLVRALYYPDRRVQLAAAEALLRIPGSAGSLATVRVVEVLRRALAAEPLPRQRLKVLVGYFNEDVRNAVAAAVTAAGYEPVKVATGRELMQRLGQASDVALILFEETLPNPGLAQLLGELRADSTAARLPVLLSAAAPPGDESGRLPADAPRRAQVLDAAARREFALRRYTAPWPNITVIPAALPLDGAALQPLLASRLSDPASPALSAKEMKDYAERSIKNLARLARGEVAGYDPAPAGPTVLTALRPPTRLTPEGQVAAIDVVSRLKDNESQTVLADVIADDRRPLAVRVAAAAGLVRHIQQFSPLLTRDQVRVLAGVYSRPNLDLPLKNALAPVIGSLRPSARWTGERLLQYQPPAPGAAAPKPDK